MISIPTSPIAGSQPTSVTSSSSSSTSAVGLDTELARGIEIEVAPEGLTSMCSGAGRLEKLKLKVPASLASGPSMPAHILKSLMAAEAAEVEEARSLGFVEANAISIALSAIVTVELTHFASWARGSDDFTLAICETLAELTRVETFASTCLRRIPSPVRVRCCRRADGRMLRPNFCFNSTTKSRGATSKLTYRSAMYAFIAELSSGGE